MASEKKSHFGLIIAAVILSGKSAKIIAALKLLKFGKPLVTLVSLLVSTVIYGFWLGPWFSVGFVAMLFIHEMGHIIALRQKGIATSGPVFIPFLGAAIFCPPMDNRDTEAYVGIGGPVLGTIGALACLLAWFVTGQTSELLLLVSYVGIFLNLFNLIPISPLDGGRITQAVGSWFKYLGMALLFAYTVLSQQPALVLIWIIVMMDIQMRLWVRPVVMAALALSMAVLFSLGFGNQPFYVSIVDCVLAGGMTALCWYADKRRAAGDDSFRVTLDEREYPTMKVRAKWLCYYLALAALLTITIVYQAQHLPHGVHQHSEELTAPTVVQ